MSRQFQEGTHVEKGDILYQLDDALYQADLQRAEASLNKARAKLHTARLQAKRSSGLRTMQAVSEEDHENAMAALREAEADVQLARADVARNQILLDYARIQAPISGHIGKSSITGGALVNANQATPLATIRTLDPVYVDVSQSSRDYLAFREALAEGKLKVDKKTPVRITLENGQTYPHEGTLAFSEASVVPGTGSFMIRIEVPNPDGLLMPGMYAEAAIRYAKRQDAILIAPESVQRDPGASGGDGAQDRASVMVVGADQRIEKRSVILGPMIQQQWLVESGLKPGERVVTAGLQKIEPGVAVTIAEPTQRVEE